MASLGAVLYSCHVSCIALVLLQQQQIESIEKAAGFYVSKRQTKGLLLQLIHSPAGFSCTVELGQVLIASLHFPVYTVSLCHMLLQSKSLHDEQSATSGSHEALAREGWAQGPRFEHPSG